MPAQNTSWTWTASLVPAALFDGQPLYGTWLRSGKPGRAAVSGGPGEGGYLGQECERSGGTNPLWGGGRLSTR